MRPLWMEYPEDNTTYTLETSYMFGDSLLISATYPQFARILLYLPPKDDWFFLYTGTLAKKLEEPTNLQVPPDFIGVYVKAGSILAIKDIKRLSALQTLKDPFMLEIFPDPKTNKASGHLYLDDGETFNY